MEEEIDLRAYVQVLFRHWWWILGLGLLAAVVAFVVSSLQPATYEASSLVIVSESPYQMQFDPRLETTQQLNPAYKAFPALATSDGVFEAVVDAYTPTADAGIETWDLTALSGMVQSSSEGDPRLVVLSVGSRSPEDAAAIANVWADALVRRGREIYGGSEADAAFFLEQAAQAQQALDAAEAAVIEFQGRNRASLVSEQLKSLEQTLANYLHDQRNIVGVIQNLLGLRDQLAAQSASSVSLADALTALLLQVKGFGIDLAAPVQLQIGGVESLSDKSPAGQSALLADLVETLQSQSTEIDSRMEEIGPQILTLQRQSEEINVEGGRLIRARDLARETLVTLARKVDEVRIAAQEKNGILRIGSYASVPQHPVGPRRLFNSVVAALLALIVGVVGAFSVEFWRGRSRTTDGQE